MHAQNNVAVSQVLVNKAKQVLFSHREAPNTVLRHIQLIFITLNGTVSRRGMMQIHVTQMFNNMGDVCCIYHKVVLTRCKQHF